MTLPNEEVEAIERGRKMMSKILTDKKVPQRLREEARGVLRHFPYPHDLYQRYPEVPRSMFPKSDVPAPKPSPPPPVESEHWGQRKPDWPREHLVFDSDEGIVVNNGPCWVKDKVVLVESNACFAAPVAAGQNVTDIKHRSSDFIVLAGARNNQYAFRAAPSGKVDIEDCLYDNSAVGLAEREMSFRLVSAPVGGTIRYTTIRGGRVCHGCGPNDEKINMQPVTGLLHERCLFEIDWRGKDGGMGANAISLGDKTTGKVYRHCRFRVPPGMRVFAFWPGSDALCDGCEVSNDGQKWRPLTWTDSKQPDYAGFKIR